MTGVQTCALPISDNNAAERALRAVCLGKKNYIFFGSDHGGERGALLYGLMGQAAARFGLSLVRAMQGEKGVVECAYVEGDGEYARFFSQPLLLGKNGVEERQSIGKLSAFEQQALEGMLDTLKKDIALGEDFVNK